jgi:glycosyltransferase involved in cell wall biosynthesis
MKITVVTISFNQSRFVEDAILSVLNQTYPDREYIVVDAGSTDGSREIIDKYSNDIDQIIFEPDSGPADGLNKGFSQATGQIFGFLNSDDYLLPGALDRVATEFTQRPSFDVLSGHAVIVDQDDKVTNRFYSRRFNLRRFAYGASTIAQQSTFFSSFAFRKAGGFNVDNRIAWDGELWVDLAQSGAKFGRIDAFLAAHRIYSESITGGARFSAAYDEYIERMFVRIIGRERTKSDAIVKVVSKAQEYLLHPRMALARAVHGPVVPKTMGHA